MTQDDIMEELNISRGNTNMNIRELISGGLLKGDLVGREEDFPPKRYLKVMKQIVKERKT